MPLFPSENIKIVFISKYPAGKAGVSPTSWQVYGNPSLQGHRAPVCYTRIPKVMFRKSFFEVRGSYLNRQQGCPKSSLSSCYMLVQSAHGTGEAETDLCSREAEFIETEVGTNTRRDDCWFLMYLLGPLCYLCVFMMEKFTMPLLFLFLHYWRAVLCCLGCTWRVTDHREPY